MKGRVMRKWLAFGVLLVPLAVAVAAEERSSILSEGREPGRISSSRPVAFVDVTVIPMTFDGVLEHQTVVTMHGKIFAVGPVDEIVVPFGTLQIDGSGRYLMPGLADMHMHIFKTGLVIAGMCLRCISTSPTASRRYAVSVRAGSRVVKYSNGGIKLTRGFLPDLKY